MKIFFFVLLSLIALAQVVDWEARYKEVCAVDPKFCPRLKEQDGTWLRPKKTLLQVLGQSDIQKQIQAMGKKYGVEPIAIAGAITAENSLNVAVDDSISDWIATNTIFTNVGGKDISFGLGQITMPAAMEAEEHIAKLENRKPLSYDDVKKEVTSPTGSVKYAAMILRKVQDDYAAEGFDISKDPAVLATLYNLGGSEERAKKAKQEGRKPRSNYFGLFVEKNLETIRTASGIAAPPKPVVVALPKPVPPLVAKPVVAAKPVASVAPVPVKKMVAVDTVSKSLGLVAAPMFCKRSDYGQSIAADTANKSFGAPVGALAKGVAFTEVSRALDCNAAPWKLIRTADGDEGWVEESKLDQVKITEMQEEKKCVRSPEAVACEKKISEATDKLKVTSDKKSGLVYLRAVSSEEAQKEKKEITFDQEDMTCGYVSPTITSSPVSGAAGISGANAGKPYTQSNYAYYFNVVSMTPLKPEDKKPLQENLKFLDGELARMAKAMKHKPTYNTDARNPYNTIALILEQHKTQTIGCLKSFDSEESGCSAPPLSKEYRDAVSKIKYNKSPDLEEINRIRRGIATSGWYGGGFGTSNAYFPLDDEVAKTTVAQVREALFNCQSRVKEIDPKKFGGQSINDLRSVMEKATDEKVEEHKKYLMTFAKTCHGRLNAVNKDFKGKNPIECVQSPAMMLHDYELFSKELLANTYQKSPDQLIQSLDGRAQQMISQKLRDDLSGWQPPPPPPKAVSPVLPANVPVGYCPNKTAEYIEDLVKANPCVKRVYVPTRFLVTRLGDEEVGSKVLFRQFENDGQYAIDVGAACQ